MESTALAQVASRRLPRACAACARRKIRCDRRRPCRPCLQRNQGRDCLGTLMENTSFDINGSKTATLELELSLLRERVAELEAELSGPTHQPGGHESVEFGLRTSSYENCQAADSQEVHIPQQELETLENAFEDFNLGIPPQGGTPVEAFLSPRSPLRPQKWPLPSRNTSLKIVKFALNELGWIHCALRARVFLQEHEEFWTSLQSLNYGVLKKHSWLAKLYAVLAVGLYYMDPTDDCFHDFTFLEPEATYLPPRSLQESATLAKVWYRGSLHELELSDFLRKAKLSSIQTIAILPLINASFGETEREWLMMGAAINMARSLQMHKLKKEGTWDRSAVKPAWLTRESRSLGRRLWWTLCICDWLGNMSRPTSIAPGSFTTEMEPILDDEDDITLERPHIDGCASSGMSLLDYHHTMVKLASIIQRYIKDGRGSSDNNLVSAMQAVEDTYASCPLHLREWQVGVPTSQGAVVCHHHKWGAFQGYLFTHTIQFMRLTIARSHLSEWLERRSDRHNFHAKAIEAAEIIVQEKARDVSYMFRKSWIVCASTVAAGVILALDLLCFSAGADESILCRRRAGIQSCISALDCLQATNAISKGGPEVLRRLLTLETTWDHTTLKNKDTLRSIMKYVAAREDSVEQIFSPQPANPAFPSLGLLTLDTPAPMEWMTASPDVFDGIFESAITEIDMFENPFEFNDSNYYTTNEGV